MDRNTKNDGGNEKYIKKMMQNFKHSDCPSENYF